ncbi:hypothetical protein [Maioricimonas sp. JC845]|uniref:hypothetical protein n=1 Tax=Maioricimonas sp. JC845 TaxID=3232138 RepID=UPI00345A8C42
MVDCSLTLGALLIGDRSWVQPAILLLVGAALLVATVYVRAGAAAGTRVAAGLLKLAAFALLAACIIEPLWSGTRAKPGANLFLVVADDSASLQVDTLDDQTRGEELKSVLENDMAPWRVRLAQDFTVRYYQAGSRLNSVEGFADLGFEDPSSMLGGALETLRSRFSGRPVAGILLFTDGNATDLSERSLEQLGELCPIYPVLPSGGTAGSDIAIDSVSATESAFEDAPVTIKAEVRATGTPPEQFVAELLDEDGEVLETQRSGPNEDGSPTAFRFQTRPEKPGLAFYQVRVQADSEGSAAKEATDANNLRTVAVNRERGPYRILYVSGRPNWEFKFLNRALLEDESLQLVGMIRIARREAKFDFRGRAGESSNPLFRGFRKDSDEETESYDEPVIVRIGTRDESELRDGFPEEKAELYRYHAIVLDDIEADFFTSDQLTLIERFVSERGGSMLMLGGPDTFASGGYRRTPIEDVLPVYLDRPPSVQLGEEYSLELTREGWLEPWVRLRTSEEAERQRLGSMPQARVVSRVRGIKPAAQPLATVRSRAGERLPALVVHSYGAGRGAALLVGDLWRWAVARGEDDEDDLEKSWRQTARWLVSDVPERVEASITPTKAGDSDAVLLQVRLRDEQYRPLDNASARVEIQPPGDEPPLTLDAEPSLEEAGLFEVTYVPRQAGAYRASVMATGGEGDWAGQTELGWTSEPAADEFRSVEINRPLMSELARRSGGEVLEPSDLESFVQTLPTRRVPVTESWTSPLWHNPWILLVVLALLAGEWGLRRWKGLP